MALDIFVQELSVRKKISLPVELNTLSPLYMVLITWRLSIPETTYNYLVRTSQITRRNSTRQERREADKMATMRKRGIRLSE
jgi:hypothetical protein